MLEQELFDLLEGTSDAAFAVTDQGEICSWNKAAEKRFGYSSTEAISNTCYNLLQGRRALGTRVCGENCSVRDCSSARSVKRCSRPRHGWPSNKATRRG
jgi:PAS domain S-box-containing protein